MEFPERFNQHFSQFLDPVALECSEQDKRYCGKIDQPADPDQPDRALQLAMNKIPVQQIQNKCDNGSHCLVGDETDRNRHGAVSHRNSRFSHGIHLHRLSAGGTGGDITVVEPDQSNIDRPADTEFKPLASEIKPVVHAVADSIDQPAAKYTCQPVHIHFFDGVPRVCQIFIAECDEKNSGNGKSDEQKTQ